MQTFNNLEYNHLFQRFINFMYNKGLSKWILRPMQSQKVSGWSKVFLLEEQLNKKKYK